MRKKADEDGWDSATVIRLVQAQSKRTLSKRQLQQWDRSDLVRASIRGRRGKRLYSFQDVRRLCIIARLLGARVPTQRLRVAIKNIEHAHSGLGQPWDRLRIVTDGNSVFVVDGDQALDALRNQVVSLILLGDLEESARTACGRVKPEQPADRLARASRRK